MIKIADFKTSPLIYESENSLVYREWCEQHQRPVILKVLKEDYPTPGELARYKQEFEITRSLKLEGTVNAYSLKKYQNTLVIALST